MSFTASRSSGVTVRIRGVVSTRSIITPFARGGVTRRLTMLGCGERTSDRRAARVGGRIDRAAMRLDQALGDRESQPGSVDLGGGREPIEHEWQEFGVDAGARVLDRERHVLVRC